ncbi:MAG: ribosome small subunit-dependent GTPase A [Desulfobacterales bacterium]|nr:ribosome small subunit-dependent GTPase A [Desulfobacterales bacterium]MCP4160141.1 ribosome small subunit-dependent GTPase A [Deltaproteobacteria bacterium]
MTNEDKRKGIIVGHYGVAVDVKFDDGLIESIRVKRKSGHVVGDYIYMDGNFLKRMERNTIVHRRSQGGSTHVVASNLDVLGIVVSSTPVSPKGFIDRTIVAARSSSVNPFIVVNKSDLESSVTLYNEIKPVYESSIPVFLANTIDNNGIDSIKNYFSAGLRGAFVGVSGVGKSSILNSMCKDIELVTGELSYRNEKGRHTTTTSTLHELDTGGELIDTPGFRDFGVANILVDELSEYYCGFDNLKEGYCKFRNCLHVNEPDCHVKSCLESNELSESRYETYLSLLSDIKKSSI